MKILVGKGAAHNDELTLQVAKPHHAWLHARDEAGAHVVVVTAKGQKLTSEQLVDAAHLAAHFSKARGEESVDVAYTEKRYVRKPRKSPVGSVVLDREKVIHVRILPERLAALLKTNLPAINAQLNRAITPYLHTSGEIKQLKLIGLLAGESGVQAQLFVRAELSVTDTGLPR